MSKADAKKEVKGYVIYIRVSTKEQGDKRNGLEAQEAGARAYVASLGGTVEGVYCDMVSGAGKLRPEQNRALDAVRETGADLVVWELDRLSRDAANSMAIRKALSEAGAQIHVAALGRVLDLMTFSVVAAMAEAEREKISKRVREGLEARERRTGARNGRSKGADTSAAREVSKQQRRKAAMDKSMIARNFVEMELERGTSYRKIADALNRLGLKTPTGKAYSVSSVQRIVKIHDLSKKEVQA